MLVYFLTIIRNKELNPKNKIYDEFRGEVCVRVCVCVCVCESKSLVWNEIVADV